MTQPAKPKKSHIKVTQIPLSIQAGSTLGIANFPSVKYGLSLEKPSISVLNHQQQITFKNAVGRVQDSDEDSEEFVSKRVVNYNRVTIKPANMSQRYFRLDIPVQRGPPAGVKNYREKINFVIEFNQDRKGTISLIDDIYDTQAQITNENPEFTMEERIKIAQMKLDARRKEEKVEVDDKKDGRKKQK